MPIFDEFKTKDNHILVWKIEESEEDLLFIFSDYSKENIQNKQINNESARIQKIASRLVTAIVCNLEGLDYDDIIKDKFNKPIFKNSNLYLSITHTKGYAAAVISKKNIGIDLELISPKANLLKTKFCNGFELKKNYSEFDFTQIWSLKESIYKAYGEKRVIFSKEILIESEEKGVLRKNKIELEYELFTKNYSNEIILTYAIQN